MNKKICSFCGHGDCDNSLRTQIKAAITDIIENEGITTFYSGGIGAFDSLCESVVRELKRTYPLKLYLIAPYMTQKINRDGKYYKELYDDIIIPDLGEIHYKRAITERNKWIAEQSDIILCYIYRSSGGAYQMYQYAQKLCKKDWEEMEKLIGKNAEEFTASSKKEVVYGEVVFNTLPDPQDKRKVKYYLGKITRLE